MRDVYNLRPKYQKITQGSIIRGCIANGYNGCDIYGLIITARCDLAQEKVNTVHYLPIVSYDDWLKKEIVAALRQELILERKKKVIEKLNEKKLPNSFLDRGLSRAQIEKSFSANSKGKKECESFMALYDNWENACHCKDDVLLCEKDAEGLLKNNINLLINHGKSEWYLIEDWERNISSSGFKIILLREIGTLSIDCALKMANGIMEDDVSEDFFKYNMLKRTNDRSSLYYIESEIKSPYIEHILQRFTNNFARIGLDDIPRIDTISQLVNYSKKILK